MAENNDIVRYMETNNIPGTEIKKPSCKLVGRDGNAYAVMGAVKVALRKAKVPEAVISAYLAEAMSGDYNHLLATSCNYVSVR